MSSLLTRMAGIFLITALIIVLCQAQVNTLFSEWRPNSDSRGVNFIGSKACAECHPRQARYLSTAMAQALEVAPNCRIVTRLGRLTFQNGPFTYNIAREGGTVTYSVNDGQNSIKEPIVYCFGRGDVGQTYIFRHNGLLYETRVSYFDKLGRLDFTIGHRQSVPTSVDDALGRTIGGDEPRQCFGCHSTGAVNGMELKLDRLTPGVGCEACHGPGEKHAVAMKDKKDERAQIFNPRNLGATDLSQSFCGSCHTSFEQAMLMPGQSGINNIRFQPYRMFNSPGHNTNDLRTSCLACHNPHEQLAREPVYYDSKCLACHLTTAKDIKTERRNAAACPVSTKNCVTCHMPKVELPGMHAAFTDHWIRIAKPGEPVPR
ncbi:MAG TPA: multiheme c-type cytochrome [Pyrinomonadaceae bacterium]